MEKKKLGMDRSASSSWNTAEKRSMYDLSAPPGTGPIYAGGRGGVLPVSTLPATAILDSVLGSPLAQTSALPT